MVSMEKQTLKNSICNMCLCWTLQISVIAKTHYVYLDQAVDNTTLYGVCLHVPEIVQRPPGILGISSPHSLVSSRFMVSAPRCYCLLTRVPFFELHFEMLNRLALLLAY